MWPFWLLFLVPVWAVLSPQRLTRDSQKIVWFAVAVLFAVVIGLRHQVGGDWYNYLRQLDAVRGMTFHEVITVHDPAYFVINWLVLQLGGGIYMINLVCGCIVMIGVVTFCRRQPQPWLALTVAVPYFIVVVAMGYTRQSVALALALIGLTALGQQRPFRFVIWVLLGALFHKSAVLLLPIAALASSRRRLWTVIWVAATSVVGAYLLLHNSEQILWTNYVEQEMQSEGGALRVAMNALPAVLFLLFEGKLQLQPAERRLWRWMSICALACVPLVFVASTAVDRVALYFIPVQMVSFARLPALARTSRGRTDIMVGVIAYYALAQFVWLNYAVNASYWVPYTFMPL